MTTIARLQLVADTDTAAAEAKLTRLDRLVNERIAKWSTHSRAFVEDTGRESAATRVLASTTEQAHTRIGKAVQESSQRHLHFDRVLNSVGSQLTRMSARAAILVGPMSVLATGAFQVASALTPVIGLAGALPGALAAGGVAAAAGGLAFAGMSDALKAMTAAQDGTTASQEKLREVMAGLPPAARPVVRQLFDLRGELSRLRQTAAAGIMPGVSSALERVQVLFPVVRQGIGAVSAVLGDLADRAARLAAARVDDLRGILADSAAVTRNFGNAGIDLTAALFDVAAEARPLVRWIGALVEQGARLVRRFIEAKRESGELGAFFTAARERAEQLGRIIFNVARIIGDLAKVAAPSGGKVLDFIEDLTGRAADASSNIQQLRDKVMLAVDAFTILKGALIGAALGPWGVVAGVVAGGLVVLYRRSEAFRDVIGKIGAFIRDRVVPALAELWGWVQEKLIPAFVAIIPFVRDHLLAGFSRLTSAFRDNKEQLGQVGRVIVAVGQWIATKLAPFLVKLYAVYLEGLMTALGGVITVLGAAIRWFGMFWGAMNTARRRVVEFVEAAVARCREFKEKAGAAIGEFVRGLRDKMRGALDNVKQWGRDVIDWLKGRKQALIDTGKTMWQGLVDGIKSIDLIGKLKEIVGGAIDWVKRILRISSPSAVMYDIGRNMMLGVAGGIRDHAPDIFEGFLDKIDPSLIMRAISGLKNIGADLLKRLGGVFGNLFGGGGSGSARGLVGYALDAFGVFRRMFPWMTIGGWRARGSVPGSDHPKGKALDLMTTSSTVANAIIAMFRQLPGAKYWIWNRRIATAASGWGARAYHGPSPHTDHVHLSFFQSGAWRVLRDTLAYIHRGELVVPERVAEPFRRFIDALGGAGLLTGRTGTAARPALAGVGGVGGGGGTTVYQFNVSLNGTYAEPITRADVHTAIAAALGQLQVAVVKGGRV